MTDPETPYGRIHILARGGRRLDENGEPEPIPDRVPSPEQAAFLAGFKAALLGAPVGEFWIAEAERRYS